MRDWATARGKIVGAMSAPNKFVAAATGSGVSITPEVTIKMGYSDWRWLALVAFVVASMPRRIVKRVRGRQRSIQGQGESLIFAISEEQNENH
jgi:hypothetical protein